ncbi:hypothetical protein ES708_33837 [subsurface metagenome]
MTDTQPQPRPTAHLFGGEEGVKEVPQVLIGNSGSVIGKGSLYLVAHLFRGDGQGAFIMGLFHEMLGIDDNVKEHLLQLKIVSHDLGQVRGKAAFDRDIFHPLLVGTQFQHLLDNIVYIQHLLDGGVLSGKGEEVLHHLRSALGFIIHHLHILPDIIRHFLV